MTSQLKHSARVFTGVLFFAFAAANAAADVAAPARTQWKFSFGRGDLPGTIKVSPSDIYSDQAGFGFEPGATGLVAGEAALTSSKPFYFSAAVPEGNYKVTVTLGDAGGESDTTIKAEIRRLMLENIAAQKGKTVTRSFIVNVRVPEYPGGKVHLKAPRESVAEAWAWDRRLTLEINGKNPAISNLTIEKIDVPTVYLLGDSTVCDQPGEPYASWGQMLPVFFKPDIAIANHAESGETLKTSAGAHRLDKVLSLLKPGDYVMIQYGHNDMKTKEPDGEQIYKSELKSWVKQIKAKGASPILITSMNRYSFTGGTITNTFRGYPDRVRETAGEESVPLIDLNAMSKTLYESLGPEAAVKLFEHEPGSSKFDHTHHSPYGAYELARCIVQGIRDDKLDLATHIAAEVPEFSPAKPDAEDQVNIPTSPSFTNQRPLGD
jgi:lysophospholipase L1-like esterase